MLVVSSDGSLYRAGLFRRLRRSQPFLGWAVAIIAGVLAVVVTLKGTTPITYRLLFRDVVSSAEVPLTQGALSQFGIMVWAVAIGVLLLGTTMAYRRRLPVFRFLLSSLAITTVLAVDDAFLLHEAGFDQLFGISEKVVLAVYGTAIVGYLTYFRSRIFGDPQLLLLLALLALATSVGIDAVPRIAVLVWRDGLFLLEDGAKLAGIVFWAAYYLRFCVTALSSRAGVGERRS